MIQKENFQLILDGKQIDLYILSNANGLKLSVTNYGARVVEFWVPDKNNHFEDIVLGYNSIEKYLNNTGERFLGAACGRVANRIAHGIFYIDDKKYHIPTNNNGNTLHGGLKGLDSIVWNVEDYKSSKITFSYLSRHMEEGFPGNLKITMSYELTDNNEFKITYKAKTDQTTPVNLTHHSFFNLHGEGKKSINDHILQINAEHFTPINEYLIPTGEIVSVKNTPMDFRNPTTIGKRIANHYDQLKFASGYDHNWVLSSYKKGHISLAATLFEPTSGRFVEILTDQPGLQFYGGNFFDGKTASKQGNSTYNFRSALALETQHFPDAPNHQHFPSILLHPEDEYRHTCIYRFSILQD